MHQARFYCFLFVILLWKILPLNALETGSDAPLFRLPGSDGQVYTLSDFRGSYVVLEWINYECPFVKKHYDQGDMQRLQKTWVEQGVVWLSILSSAPGKQGYMDGSVASEALEAQGAHATALLLDPSGEVGRNYEAKTTPHLFVINPEGQIIYQGAIDSIRSFNSSDIADADNYVHSALEAAMKGVAVENPNTQPYGCSVKY